MAKKYLSLDRLTEYDALLKAKIAEGDESTLESAKGYADEKLAGLTGGTTTVAKAEEATHATSADTAAQATEATHATTADTATNATKAEEATHAVSADTATSATNAANATHATTADTATSATNATNATKATQDASGNVITDTYETKTAAAAKLIEAKGYTDDKLATLTSGTTTVAKATEATKSTQDASGNVITETYETKADATAKLTEAKGYADTAASNAATAVKNELLNGAGEAYDTLKELGDLIDDNHDAIDALETVASNKADKEHEHTVSDITDYVAPVQANWNQNDETALDYVQNRPFYGVLEDTTILEETTIEPDEDGSSEVYFPLIPLKEDKEYTVVFDGESYECVAVYDPEYDEYFIENELFWVVSCPSDDETYIGWDGDGTHTISVSTMTGEVTKLDKMYLPDSVFAKPDWDENNPAADGFIKNRPFSRYLDYGRVLKEFTFGGNEYSDTYTSTVLNRFVAGQPYDVYFDGELYEGVVFDGECLGSTGAWEGNFDEYPFGIYIAYHYDDEEEFNVDNFNIYTETEGSHSISIEGLVYYYVQLDEAYLPSSIIADWDETNPNKKSYIKNKPFGESVVENVIIPETNFNGAQYSFNADIESFNLGETYTVIFDGEVYPDLVCGNYNGVPAIGRISQETENLTFMIGIKNYSASALAMNSGSHSISVVQYSTEIKTLDPKFLPEIDLDGAVDEAKAYTDEVAEGKADKEHAHSWNDLEDKPFGEQEDGSIKTIKTKYLPEHLQFGVKEAEVKQTYTTILAEKDYNFGSSSGTTMSTPILTVPNQLVIGEKYLVVWDGVEYELTSWASGSVAFLGDEYANVVSGSAENPPFSIRNLGSGIGMYTILADSSPTHNVKIEHITEEIVPESFTTIDPKYLPEHTHTVSESDLDSALAEKVNAASEGNHSHLNKDVIDGITADKVSAWDTAVTTANEAKTTGEANTSAISANTSSIQAHTTAIGNLQTAVAEFEEITAAEIEALFA